MITLDQAKNLRHGQTLYHVSNRNADGSPQRWRVNGAVKVWKTRPQEVRVPIKHGLYNFDYLDQTGLDLVCLTEDEAKNGPVKVEPVKSDNDKWWDIVEAAVKLGNREV